MKRFFQIIIMFFCFFMEIGFVSNLADYSLAQLIVIFLLMCIFCIPVILIVHNIFFKTNKCVKSETLTSNAPATEDFISVEPVNQVSSTPKFSSCEKNINYIETNDTIIKSDGSPITDEEIPEFIRISYERQLYEIEQIRKSSHFDTSIFKNDELLFFTALVNSLNENCLKSHLLRVERLGDGTLNVFHDEVYLGKILLNSNKNYMQYLNGLYDVKELNNPTLNKCINTIPRWITYINYCKHHSFK